MIEELRPRSIFSEPEEEPSEDDVFEFGVGRIEGADLQVCAHNGTGQSKARECLATTYADFVFPQEIKVPSNGIEKFRTKLFSLGWMAAVQSSAVKAEGGGLTTGVAVAVSKQFVAQELPLLCPMRLSHRLAGLQVFFVQFWQACSCVRIFSDRDRSDR